MNIRHAAGDLALVNELAGKQQLGSPVVPQVDPVTVEIVQKAFVSFIREMRGTIIRTAFGPVIWEVHDFSCALLAPDGELVALSEDHPVHIVPTIHSVAAVLDRFQKNVQPGDIFALNDPYILGSHMNDVAHLRPIFIDGILAFWLVVRVHYTDVGGAAAGSITPDATEVFQEGLLLPAVKIHDSGQPNESVIDLIFANMRDSMERRGDFMAVVGSLLTGERRLLEIVARFGVGVTRQCHRIIRDRAEARMERAIEQLPEADSSYELNLDSDGLVPGWVPLRVTIKVEHKPNRRILVDFGDSAASSRGPMNGVQATAECAAFTAIKAFLDPLAPVNGGSFRPITVTTRANTIFRARHPMPMCGATDLGGFRGPELVMGALAALRPQDAVGDFASPNHQYMAGWDGKRNRYYIFYEMPVGGTGATSDGDGSDAMAGFERGDFPRISSVEVCELQFPFMAINNQLVADSGGPGFFRGGLGMRRTWRFLADEATVTDLSEPCLTPNYGVRRGYGGSPSTCRVIRDGKVLWPGAVSGTGKATRFTLRSGDLLQFDKWGGGGYGDPLERDPQLVAHDVSEGYVSEEAAREMYGVRLDDGEVHTEATQALRQRQGADRVLLSVTMGGDDLVGGARCWEIGPEVADRLRVREEDVLECVTATTASLRGRARILEHLAPHELRVGTFAQKVLRIECGDRVWLRAVPGVLRLPHPANGRADADLRR